MSYRVLARKWRPANFGELVGQAHVLTALQNALEQGRVHHAYLLTGTRGVGKTTIARVLARCFNCEEGMSATPCGVCPACQEISEGRSLDLIEVDAASRTKVEDTRELLENSQFAPSHGRYKIYLIDEVHMLSNHSFNALLKTLEEPPEHVIFIFATTHPQKIPVTVLSRCLQFHLKNLLPEQISEHLAKVLSTENIDFETEALAMIAQAAQGSMRDALSISEQAIAFGKNNVALQNVKEMLGSVDEEYVIDLLRAVQRTQLEDALRVIQDFASFSVDFSSLIDAMMSLLHRVSLEQCQAGLGIQGQINKEVISEFAAVIDPVTIQLYYQSLLAGKRDLGYAPDPLTGMEMIVTRMLAFKPLLSNDRPTSVSPKVSETTQGKKNTELAHATANTDTNGSHISSNSDETNSLDLNSNAGLGGEDSLSSPDVSELTANTIVADSAAESVDVDIEAVDIEGFGNTQWCKAFTSMPLTGLARAIGENCQFRAATYTDASKQSALVQLALRETDSSLYKKEHDERLAQGLSIYFSIKVKVAIEIETDESLFCSIDDGLTPALFNQQKQQERQQQAIDSMQEDENVKKILSTFDASLDLESVSVIDER